MENSLCEHAQMQLRERRGIGGLVRRIGTAWRFPQTWVGKKYVERPIIRPDYAVSQRPDVRRAMKRKAGTQACGGRDVVKKR
jgi:hypothetical protein